MKNLFRTVVGTVVVSTSHEPTTGFYRTQAIGGPLDGEYRAALTDTSAAMNHHAVCYRVKKAAERAKAAHDAWVESMEESGRVW
jgi:uncharacterized protein (DUF2237 family)